MPSRHQNSAEYRYGFGGQEKDDEISGNGNSYTAEFWQYDPRLGRRWNIDPIVKYWESPYATFNNNPLFYSDPTGADGEAFVDQENKTVTVTANFYYDKSDQSLKTNAITESRTIKATGAYYEAYVSQTELSGYESKSWAVEDSDGEIWTVNFEFNFIGLDNQAAVDKKLSQDPTANALVYDPTLTDAGSYNGATRTFTLGPNRRPDGSTASHEEGHGLGLPHSYEIPGSKLFGNINNKLLNDNGSNNFGIMSYARNREITLNEVKLMMTKVIDLAKGVKANYLFIHMKGLHAIDPNPSLGL